MPEPEGYWRSVQDGEVLVGFGKRVLLCFDERDLGMRNLAVVALTQAGAKGSEVASVFGLSPEYVSRLRGRAASGGSQALVPARGAPRKLGAAAFRELVKMRNPATKDGRGDFSAPGPAMVYSDVLERVPIRIQKFQLAQSELADGRFYLGAIADHYPNHIVGMNGGLGGIRHVRGSQRANLRGIGLIVIVREPELHQIEDRGADLVHGFTRTRQPQGHTLLRALQFFGGRRPLADDVMQFFV